MKSKKIIVAALVAVAAIALAGCSPRSSMATLSTDSDSETAEVFSLAKVLNLGTNYLTSLDYDNAILQYIDIIQHDPTNKEAYAGLYAAYAAQGKADEAISFRIPSRNLRQIIPSSSVNLPKEN